MIDTCKSCGHPAPTHEPHCAWGAPSAAPTKPTIRAAIDPGSRWIAVTITSDDALDKPLRYVDARAFEVGREIKHDPPLIKIKSRKSIDGVPVEGPLATYEVHSERVLTDVEARGAATEIVAYLLSHGVAEVVTEHVKNLYGGGTVQATQSIGTELLKSSWIYTRVVDRMTEIYGVPVRYVVASTWRARLVPLVKQAMLVRGGQVKGVMIKGRGAALDPVLAEHIEGWPGASAWSSEHVEHIRDSTGLALACALPELRKVKRVGPARPRAARMGSDGQRQKLSHAARRRAVVAGCIRAKRKRAAERAAGGCSCRVEGASPLKHGPACRVSVAAAAARDSTCTCREGSTSRSGAHRKSCVFAVATRKARAAACSCETVTVLRASRHRRTCAMFVPKVATSLCQG